MKNRFQQDNTIPSEKNDDICINSPAYHGLYSDNSYAGLDFGPDNPGRITKVRFFPWLNAPSLMVGGRFQGSNTSKDEGFEDLHTITAIPFVGWNEALITSQKSYRYVRYQGPPGSHCIVSRLEFYAGNTKLSGTPFGAKPAHPEWDFENIFQEGPDVILSFHQFADEMGLPFYFSVDTKRDSFYHQHDFLELLYIKSGSCFHVYHNHITHLFAGDFLAIPPGMNHHYFGASNLLLVNMLIYPRLLPEPLRQHVSELYGLALLFDTGSGFLVGNSRVNHIHLDVLHQQTMIPLFEQLEETFCKRQEDYKITSLAYLLQFFVSLSQCLKTMNSSKTGEQESLRRYKIVAAAIEYIQQNYAVMDNVKEILQHLQVSYSRLANVFKEETGLTLNDYLTRIRIGQACHLLTESDEEITEIAGLVGFTTYGNFGRFFKQIVGYAPQDFRNAKRKR